MREKAEREVLAAVEFAEASPEPALDTLYENLYVLDERAGWYAVDERSPEPHRGEREDESMPDAAPRAGRGGRRLRRAADGPRPNPAERRRRRAGVEPEVAGEVEDGGGRERGAEEVED